MNCPRCGGDLVKTEVNPSVALWECADLDCRPERPAFSKLLVLALVDETKRRGAALRDRVASRVKRGVHG